MRPTRFRLRLGTFLLGLTVLSVALAFIVPRFRPPSEAEVQAIRVAEKLYVAQWGKKPDLSKAQRLSDGAWQVELTGILAPLPNGYHWTETYRVDSDGSCHFVSFRDRGAY